MVWWALAIFSCLTVCSEAREQFIVGGTSVPISQFQFVGSYRNAQDNHVCGCVFIGEKYVITAAFCGGSNGYNLRLGSANHNNGHIFPVDSVTTHPDYGVGPGFSPNDFSLVEATSSISGANIAAAIMADTSDVPSSTGWITGWGRTCSSCSLSNTLNGAEISIIEDDICQAYLGNSFQRDQMICIHDRMNEEVAPCNGDGGGALSHVTGNTLYGLYSWSLSACNPTYPSVYTKVAAYKSWVCGRTNNVPTGC